MNKTELGKALRLTSQQLTNLERHGLPVDRSNGRPVYELAAVLAWYVGFKQDAVRDRKPSTRTDADTRKAVAQAELAELELAQVKGQLVTLDDYEAGLSRVTGLLASIIRSAAGKWAPALVGLETVAEAQQRADELLRDLLEVLSQGGKNGDGGDASDRKSGARATTRAAAAPKRQRVGRSKPGPKSRSKR